MEPKKKWWKCDKKTLIFGTAFLVFVVVIITMYFVFQNEIKSVVDDYVSFMKKNKALGVFLFAIAYTISMPIWIPATLFILFGGYIFGRVFGFLAGFFIFVLVDYVCMEIGWLLAFWNARYLFKNWVQSCIEQRPKLKATSMALSYNAKKMVALLRIWAITPYYIFNYLWGVTTMSTKDYMIGNLVIIICDAPYIYVWASISDISSVSSNPLGPWYYVLLAIGLLIVIIVIVMTYIYAKRELRKILNKIKIEKEELERRQREQENRINQNNDQNHRHLNNVNDSSRNSHRNTHRNIVES